ncbi:hypothetical protein ABZ473_19825 [Streptomyces cellulosae]
MGSEWPAAAAYGGQSKPRTCVRLARCIRVQARLTSSRPETTSTRSPGCAKRLPARYSDIGSETWERTAFNACSFSGSTASSALSGGTAA